jgi:hypothetical protein
MITRLELRWAQWEQLLLLLSVILHLQYRTLKFKSTQNIFYTHFEQWLVYYY